MKKSIILSLLVILCFILISCGTQNMPTKNKEFQKELTPIEALTEDEMILFEALKNMSYNSISPEETSLLEIDDVRVCSYNEHDNEDDNAKDYAAYYDTLGEGTFYIASVRVVGEFENNIKENTYYTIRLNTLEKYAVDFPSDYYTYSWEVNTVEWDLSSVMEYLPDFSERCYVEFKCAKTYCSKTYAQENISNFTKGQSEKCYDKNAGWEIPELDVNIAKINKALQYYWNEEMGIY